MMARPILFPSNFPTHAAHLRPDPVPYIPFAENGSFPCLLESPAGESEEKEIGQEGHGHQDSNYQATVPRQVDHPLLAPNWPRPDFAWRRLSKQATAHGDNEV